MGDAGSDAFVGAVTSGVVGTVGSSGLAGDSIEQLVSPEIAGALGASTRKVVKGGAEFLLDEGLDKAIGGAVEANIDRALGSDDDNEVDDDDCC